MSNSKGPSSAATEHDLNCLTIKELEDLARERMDKQTRDYYNEGADSGSTLVENIDAYKKYRIRPRVLRDISEIDTSVEVFGRRNSVPFGVAPTAMQCLAHSEGEVANARACRKAGVVMGLSSFSTSTLEDVAEASGDNPRVLQLYLFEDRDHSHRLIERAKRAGYSAIFLTVDTPMLGRRNLELRNQFQLPKHIKIANFVDDVNDVDTIDQATGDQSTAKSPKSEESNTSKARQSPTHKPPRPPPTGPITFHSHAPNPTLTWTSAIPWLKSVAGPLKIYLKGIMTSEDALLALSHGIDGIVVSNHGGRQLDGALATLDALPDIVSAVRTHESSTNSQSRLPIHIDGGIRHGTDVFKALALGADFCWVGRPILWGLAYKGEEGVGLCLRLLKDETRLCMGLAGTVRVEDIGNDYLVRIDRSGFVSRL